MRGRERPLTGSFHGESERQELARSATVESGGRDQRREVILLRNLRRIVDLDPEVSDRAFEFSVELNRPEILGPAAGCSPLFIAPERRTWF